MIYMNNLVGDVKASPKDFYRYILSRQAIGPECVERNSSKLVTKGCLRLVINELSFKIW